jgi:type I restriction enzyme S subunit
MSDALPQGWITTRISELAETRSGGTPSTAKREYWDNGDVPWINSGALKDCIISQPSTYITKLGSKNSAAKLFPKNTVVIALTGATTGRVGILDFACSANQSVTGIFPSEAFLPSYLFNFLRSARPAVLELAIGSAQPHINKRIVDDFEVPLGPLPEQRRIMAKLEALLGKVDANQQRLAKIPVLLKRFRQSVLAAACSGRLTADWREVMPDTEPASALLERIACQSGQTLSKCDANELSFDIPSSWESIQASDLCRPRKIITYGVLKPVWVKDGVPTVRVQDMKQGEIVVEAVAQCCPERAKKFLKTTLETGDLLIAKDGATLGKTAFVPPELAGGNITQHVLRFPISLLVESVFVRLIIDSRHGQEWMRIETRGAALPGVNVGDFRRMPIPLPPLAEQQEIVRRVEGLFALADQLELRLAKARGQVDKLTPSLLARAFNGQLVPQDPNDEPASVLLARIRSDTNGGKKPARAKSKT